MKDVSLNSVTWWLLTMGLLVSAPGFGADRPNIVFMQSDDQSWYGLSVQMHPDLPNSKSDFYNVRTNDPNTPAPLLGAKGNVSEGGIRVPFIIRGPGIEANSLSHVPIVGWDLFTTYAQWAEIDPADLPEGIEGGSIVSVLENGGVGEVERPFPGMVFHFPHYQAGTPQSAIRAGGYKLIKYFETNQAVLFNIAEDVGERHTLRRRCRKKPPNSKRCWTVISSRCKLICPWRIRITIRPGNPGSAPETTIFRSIRGGTTFLSPESRVPSPESRVPSPES